MNSYIIGIYNDKSAQIWGNLVRHVVALPSRKLTKEVIQVLYWPCWLHLTKIKLVQKSFRHWTDEGFLEFQMISKVPELTLGLGELVNNLDVSIPPYFNVLSVYWWSSIVLTFELELNGPVSALYGQNFTLKEKAGTLSEFATMNIELLCLVVKSNKERKIKILLFLFFFMFSCFAKNIKKQI